MLVWRPGQTVMLQSEFQKGTLMRPFNQHLRREKAYYLVRPASYANAT